MGDVRSVRDGATEVVECPPVRMHFYADGEVRVEHVCKDIGAGRHLVCAPALMLGQGHTIVQREPLTIVASIACPDCGLHGFVTDGEWRGC